MIFGKCKKENVDVALFCDLVVIATIIGLIVGVIIAFNGG